jgi:hypothetical protein
VEITCPEDLARKSCVSTKSDSVRMWLFYCGTLLMFRFSLTAHITPVTVEVFAVTDQPATLEEIILSVADVPAAASVLHEEPPSNPEPDSLPLANAVQETLVAVGESSDAIEEMPSLAVIPDDAEPHAPLAGDEGLSAAAEGSSEVAQPQAETVAEALETSPAPELTSELQVETSEQKDNTANGPEEDITDINQPIHSLETANPAVEGGIMDEPIMIESATRNDLSVEKPEEITIPDEPLANTTADIYNGASAGESVHSKERTPGWRWPHLHRERSNR